jgi:uncharacterized protein YndB with AHSA1/START domain
MRGSLWLVAAALVWSPPARGEATWAKKGALVVVSGSTEVKAPKAKVWKALTSADGLAAIAGFKFDTKPPKPLKEVGDHFSGQLSGDKGVFVATTVRPEEELRLTWAPAEGHYLCACRVLLKPSATGTTVEYTDMYTDEKPAQVDENAKSTTKDMTSSLEKFKALAEK